MSETEPEPSRTRQAISHVPAVSPAAAVFFDGAPIFEYFDGVVRITLVTARTASKGSKVAEELVVAGYLRCGLQAAMRLRATLDKAILTARKHRGATQ